MAQDRPCRRFPPCSSCARVCAHPPSGVAGRAGPQPEHAPRGRGHAHLSQPALSKLLAEAEELAGQTLFERSHHGVTPTPLGLMMIGRARLLLNELDATHAELTAAASGASAARVGVFPVVASSAWPGPGAAPRIRICGSNCAKGWSSSCCPPCARVSWIASSGGWWWRARTPTCNARSCTKRPPRRSAAPRIRWRPAAGWAALS